MSCKQLSSLHVIKTKEQGARAEAMCSQAGESVQREAEASVTICCGSVQGAHRPAGNPKALGGDTGPLGPPLQAPQTPRLKHQTFLFSEPRRLEIRTQVLAWLLLRPLGEELLQASFLSVQTAGLSLCVRMVVPRCVSVSFPLLVRTPVTRP